jgi:hypothetical protein
MLLHSRVLAIQKRKIQLPLYFVNSQGKFHAFVPQGKKERKKGLKQVYPYILQNFTFSIRG